MSLRTGKILRRRRLTELLTTEEVIKQVHTFAINEKKSEKDDEPTIYFNFYCDKDNNQPIGPFDYSVQEPLLHAPEGANEEPNKDGLSVDNKDTEQDIDQELTIDETDDDDITADGDNTSVIADGDDTSITTDGDDTQQDETDPITDTNNENTHEDVQMETAVLETDEDQGAPQLEYQGANEEEEKEQEKEEIGQEEEQETLK